jgi:hypothetical protein
LIHVTRVARAASALIVSRLHVVLDIVERQFDVGKWATILQIASGPSTREQTRRR